MPTPNWTNTTESFGIDSLKDSTFRILETRKEKIQGSKGSYDAPCVLAEVKGFLSPIWVRVTKKDYDKLRMLGMSGIKVFTLTYGAKDEKGYADHIFAGGKDW